MIELGDHTYRVAEQPTARAVLDAKIRMTAEVVEAAGDGAPGDLPFMDMTDLAHWCGRWVEVSAERIDERHSPIHIVHLKRKIIREASLDQWVIDDLQAAWRVALEGGCDCPVCNPEVDGADSLDDLPPAKREAFGCEFEGISQFAKANIGYLGDLLDDAATLDDPWWTYQCRQAYSATVGQWREEQQKKRESVETAKKVQKRRGIR